jgi:hypothetical protein
LGDLIKIGFIPVVFQEYGLKGENVFGYNDANNITYI